MAQWSRALVALAKDPDPILNTYKTMPTPGDLMPSSGLHRHQQHTWCTNTQAGKTPVHINRRKKLNIKFIKYRLIHHRNSAIAWKGIIRNKDTLITQEPPRVLEVLFRNTGQSPHSPLYCTPTWTTDAKISSSLYFDHNTVGAKPNTWNMDSAAILAKGYIRITLLITIIIITVIRIITAEPVVFVI